MPVNVLTVLVGRIGANLLGLCFSTSQAKVYLGFRLRKEGTGPSGTDGFKV